MTQSKPFPIHSRSLSSQPTQSAALALTLLGPSSAMAQLWAQVRRLAPHVRTVLLTGERDCGQEAVARLLLDFSPQSHRAFLELSASDAESRLLRPAGLVSFPSDVLVYIPDVHRYSRAAQDALLRLVKMRRARPFTVVAAASEDLRALVGLGSFSPELADTLSGVRIALPSLKQRAEDIPMLISQLLASLSVQTGKPAPHTSEDFLRVAMAYGWPGNLRELSHAMRHLCGSASQEPLQAADLQRALAARQASRPAESVVVRLVSLDTVMHEHIASVLHACQGNKLRAAETLGISRSTLYRMLDAASATGNMPLSLAS